MSLILIVLFNSDKAYALSVQHPARDPIPLQVDAHKHNTNFSKGDNVGGRCGSCPAGFSAATAVAAAPPRCGMFGAGEQGAPWHQLQFIPTLDPATGRPAILVNESVITALKQVLYVFEMDTIEILTPNSFNVSDELDDRLR